MNATRKVVFSRTLSQADWQNTRLFSGELASAVRELRAEPGPDLVLMGSASIVSQLAQQALLDSLQLVINPIVLGAGESMFQGLQQAMKWKLSGTRAFENGNVSLRYEHVR